jgi:predicted metal-dependent HD superfamily phosphohydrolase
MLTPERLAALHHNWVGLLQRYRVATPDVGPPFELLVAAYSAPDRHYHNLEHLDEMFQVAARLVDPAADPGPLQLAIWFHDAVYDPRAGDNEARSADLAIALLRPIGVSASVLEQVTRLIGTTAHLADLRPPEDRDAMTLLDADLEVLGAPEDRYRQYASAIRHEYAWVPDAEYRPARARTEALPRPAAHLLARRAVPGARAAGDREHEGRTGAVAGVTTRGGQISDRSPRTG